MVKNLPATAGDAGDTGSIPGSGRSPGGGHGNPLQYSCLENPMERGAWWATVQGVTETTECVHTHTLHSPRHHSQKRLSSRMHTHARTHARTHAHTLPISGPLHCSSLCLLFAGLFTCCVLCFQVSEYTYSKGAFGKDIISSGLTCFPVDLY